MTPSTLTLKARTPMDISVARHDLQHRLESWQCSNVHDVLLVFSELVTNAVTHAGGAQGITVRHGEHTLRLEVYDRTHAAPEPRPHDGQPGGLGLHIVDSLSRRWGWDQTSDGKVVWSDVPLRDELE